MSESIRVFKVRGVYHYRYRLDGRRRQRTTRERGLRKAQSIADDAYAQAVARSRGEEPEPTLGALAALWIEVHSRTMSEDRIGTMETFARLHIQTLADLTLRELTTERVEEARALYLQDHARSSANTWLGCLGALVRWAIRRRMIRQVPWQVRELKVHRKAKPILPTGKASLWMCTVGEMTEDDPGLGFAIRLMIGLGLRVSEALSSRWEWLDLERKTYTPSLTKGFEAWPRPVPDWLMDRLRPAAQLTGPMIPIRPGHPITEARVAYLMAKANRATGVLHITPHRLRGTYATWLSEMGVPIQDIQRALGHKDPRTTMRYLAVDMRRVAMAQIAIGDWLQMAGRETGELAPANPHES
ncbi:tyrosine-type recombinase/integrase [Mesoterricola silvestris]|uniref:Tyr recombinase domain-containing protein n=1 Tax=Mesoterricola silvestris TaxID=2927979 RepID=A0AA48GNS4_9BACT|nr:tyrosine-type recombinase/integrase [Mesoterricola silvestris]BDU72925.1 hypothetical protein METEAL_20990 [Mesoterricola silvestris]